MKNRYTFLNGLLICVLVVLSVRLVNLQIVRGEEYRMKSDSRTTKFIELTAPRGEITDRYGRSIVKNRTGYSVYIQGKQERKPYELNDIIRNLLNVCSTYSEISPDFIPVTSSGGDYEYNVDKKEREKWLKKRGFEKNLSAKELIKKLTKKYDIDKKRYGNTLSIKIAQVRMDMAEKGFSIHSPYLFSEDVPITEVSVIKEQSELFPDVCIVSQPVRDYPYGSLASHILGRVGGISSEEYEKKSEDGYTINSRIGKDGIERYMEDFLRGKNGSASMEQTSGGKSLGLNIEEKPGAGRDVSLTLDLDLQMASEKALCETIQEIRDNAGSIKGGMDADAGSVVCMDVNTGEVLAMASYPSYDIKSFGRDYTSLLENPSKPLFNRSLQGTYTPASTFKILIAMAGLEEKVITPDELIEDTGKYNYFKDYKPACWIYNQSGATHGFENVSDAIRDSCNIFFYETGRRLTIGKIDEYAEKFGFGQKSGIELSNEEQKGSVAGPENRKKMGGIWYPGDVCQTAIGQSDTLVTPLQLANYMATIANGGIRYKPYLVKSVKTPSGSSGKEKKSEVVERMDFKKENYDAVCKGIRMVVTEGTARSAFEGCNTSVAAKTGSAQTASEYTNGICIAYAPYDEPRIAIACVIEKAGSGSRTAKVIRKIVDSYFDGACEDAMSFNTLTR